MEDAAGRLGVAIAAGAFPGDAHALLVAVYRDPELPIEVRLDAAKQAIRFERPRLRASSATVRDPLAGMTAEQVERLRELAAGSAAAWPLC